MIGPPTDVTPARLFRLMLRRPRPWLSVDLSIAGIDRGFSCVAPTLREWSEIWDSAEHLPAAERAEWRRMALVVCSLQHDGVQALSDVETLADQATAHEVRTARNVVSRALSVIAPQRGLSNSDAWINRLAEGCTAPENERRAFGLALSFDSGVSHAVPRLDRFFGASPDDLTEGQWLAYLAARKAFDL